MCLSQKTINAAVLGDCGKFPLYINAAKRCIRCWCKILKMNEDRLVKKCYLIMKCLDNLGQTNWVSGVRKLLCTNGFGYVWYDQYVSQENIFISKFVQCLKDQYFQGWLETITNSSKLYSYSQYKFQLIHETYLNCVRIRKFRCSLAKLRSSSRNLEIERGRYNDTPKFNRICKLCHSAIETEFHFVLVCSKLLKRREKYIPKKYFSNTNEHKFNILMSSNSEKVLLKLAMYTYYAFQERQLILDTQQTTQDV